MITARQIREYLQAKPFKPFRLSLSDGSSHEVPHPEFAWVFGSSCLDALQSATNQVRDTLRQAVLEPLRAGADMRTFLQSGGRKQRGLKPVIARLRTRPQWRKRSRKAVPGGGANGKSSAPTEK